MNPCGCRALEVKLYMGEWTHFDEDGRVKMVNVGEKEPTHRTAIAESWVRLTDAICDKLEQRTNFKGDPFAISEIGGIMGAKNTANLIPLCHSIALNSVSVKCKYIKDKKAVHIVSEAVTVGVTGVEMEALAAVSIASLVFYDMCKGIDKGMEISSIKLIKKTGGKSGDWYCKEED